MADRRSERALDRDRIMVERERDRIAQRALARKSEPTVRPSLSYARRDSDRDLTSRDRDRDRDRGDVTMSDASVTSVQSFARDRRELHRDDDNQSRASWRSSVAADTSVTKWSAEKVSKWLVESGLAKHATLFSRQQVDGATLVALTSSDLQDELRITSLPERKQLMAAIHTLASGAASVSASAPHAPNAPHAGALDTSELTQAMEKETCVLQSIVQSEVRRATATLRHEITQLSADVAKLHALVEAAGEEPQRAASVGAGLRLFSGHNHTRRTEMG